MAYVAPTHDEARHIGDAWACLDAIARAIGAEQQAELLLVRTACWQDVRAWFPEGYSITLAECRAMRGIREGIEKKLIIGSDNDTFHYSRDPSGKDRGREMAYDFGQKLVRWNHIIERRFLDRILNRKGPLESDKILLILGVADTQFQSWWQRYIEAVDRESEELESGTD